MSNPRYEVIPSRVWKNASTGQSASIYGAVPYQRDAAAEGWAIVDVGFTIRDKVSGTVGIGRLPFTTQQEAEKVAQDMEARRGPAASA
jgi:hypothetical protein